MEKMGTGNTRSTADPDKSVGPANTYRAVRQFERFIGGIVTNSTANSGSPETGVLIATIGYDTDTVTYKRPGEEPPKV